MLERAPLCIDRVVRLYGTLDRTLAWILANARWTFGTKACRS
jgi:hypothetical protein